MNSISRKRKHSEVEETEPEKSVVVSKKSRIGSWLEYVSRFFSNFRFCDIFKVRFFYNEFIQKFSKLGGTKPIATWQTMPNEILAKIVGYMDYPSRLNLRQCALHERNIVHTFSKYGVKVQLKNPRDREFRVDLFDSEGKHVFHCFILERQSEGGKVQHLVIKNKRKLLVDESFRNHRLHEGSYEQTISDLLHSLFNDPILDFKQLIIEPNSFDAVHNYAHYFPPFESLKISSGDHDKVRSMLLNYNVKFKNSERIHWFRGMHETQEKNTFLCETLKERKNNFKIIDSAVKWYKDAFPEYCRVISMEDAVSRLQKFGTNIIKELANIDLVTDYFQDQTKLITDLMVVRATFSEDPVKILTAECYTERVSFLHNEVKESNLRGPVLATICLIYTTKYENKARKLRQNAHTALDHLLKSDGKLEKHSVLIKKNLFKR